MAREEKGRVNTGRIERVRKLVVAAVTLLVVASIVFDLGLGTPSSFGVNDVYLLCPIGSLEAALGTRAIFLRAAIAFAVVVVLAVFVGRSFCAWGCPVGFLSRWFEGKKARSARMAAQRASAERSLDAYFDGGRGAASGKRKGIRRFDSRHIVLIGALGSSAAFGFPVFCLVCPVGLTFATVVALVRFVGYNEPSLGLIVFPAVIAFELTVLRSWCRNLCPIAAFLSLLAPLNRTLRPQADASACARTARGERCNVCASVCPELIDPRADLGDRPLSECTRCARCVEACPQKALSFRLLPAKDEGREQPPSSSQ